MRVCADPDNLPMHAKVMVVQHAGVKTAWFGSFNFNRNSRWRNSEVLVRTRDTALADQLEAWTHFIHGRATQERIAAAAARETRLRALRED